MRQKAVITKLLQNVTEVYYKVIQVLQSVRGCHYKVHQVLQSATVITKWDVTHPRHISQGVLRYYVYMGTWLCKGKVNIQHTV